MSQPNRNLTRFNDKEKLLENKLVNWEQKRY